MSLKTPSSFFYPKIIPVLYSILIHSPQMGLNDAVRLSTEWELFFMLLGDLKIT